MKIIRKKWDKDSLVDFLGVRKIFDSNPKCQVLCHNEGCLFEVSLRECNLSYEDIGDTEPEYAPYWTIRCPRCGDEIILTRQDFEMRGKT